MNDNKIMFIIAAVKANNRLAQMPPQRAAPSGKDTRFKPKPKEKKEKTEFTDIIHAIKNRGGYSWTELGSEVSATLQDLINIPGWNEAMEFHFHDRNMKRWADEGQTPTPIFRILLRYALRRIMSKQSGNF